jgi:hypothetical protein
MFLASFHRAGLIACISLIAASCGGGGSSGAPLPTGFTYGTPPAFVVNQPITSLTPAITGTITGYSVSPPLPAGLSIAATTGVISGTPTVVTANASYTVTASGPGGHTMTQVPIVVNDVPPMISYASPSYSFTAGVAGQIPKPSVGGGAVINWSISPALPSGLILSSTDGSISGAASAGAPSASYTVTATNSGGAVTAVLTLTVVPAPLLDLGHGASIVTLRYNGTQVLSQDASGHWVIWQQSTHKQIASGNVCPGSCPYPNTVLPVDMAGSTVVIGTPAGLDIRAASDGHLLNSIAETDLVWWQLSTDGSYVAGATTISLEVWSTTSGQQLFSRSGDYSTAAPFSASTQVLVALGPAGANVVESIAVPSGTASSSPTFQGSFLHWFYDGGRFLTTDTNANRIDVYSNAAIKQDALIINGSLATDAYGQGNSVWTIDDTPGANTLTTYTVGASSSPSATFNIAGGYNGSALPSGLMLAVVTSDFSNTIHTISVFDFSTAAPPTEATYTIPTEAVAFAGVSGSQWVSGNRLGQILDGIHAATLGYFNYGQLASVAGSATYFAIATNGGQIFYFDAATNAQLGTISQSATKIALSADGGLLFALVPSAVNVYSLPSGTLRNIIANSSNADFESSASGAVIALVTPPGFIAYPSTGGSALWSVTANNFASFESSPLSPDGTLLAVSDFPEGFGEDSVVSVYRNGTLLNNARSDTAIGWVDNDRLIINSYDTNREPVFTGAAIYDPTGALISNLQIPMLNSIQVVNPLQAAPDLVYSAELNTIYSLSSSSATWSSASPSLNQPFNFGERSDTAAVAAQEVVFESNNFLLAEPH